MPCGYNGKILRVDLSGKAISVDEPEENFYRRYFGGRGFISYYLLREMKAGVAPLSPGNKLIFAAGVVTGVPVGGCGRNSVGGKSPLTGAYGDAEVGGYWGAELKHAGYDAIIIEGKAEKPAYLWIKDGEAEVKDAGHLWGKTTAECQEIIRSDVGEPLARTAVIGQAGENLVRYASILNDAHHAAGRTGMGAVMGSKNLKAIAVRGHNRLVLANPEAVGALAKWLKQNFLNLQGAYYSQGTASGLKSLNREGGLPTRNFQQSVFEGADKISGRAMKETILVGQGSCYACPIRCKRTVSVTEPYEVDPAYGGPEYETLASFGSNCGIDDLVAIAKANELCNAYGLDTISTGAAIAFAMECFERGVLDEEDTGGLKLKFGNASAMLQLVDIIAKREGIGDILADGVARAAGKIGKGAEEFALHVKGQEIPMHEPRYKQGLGIGYAISPKGADHTFSIHDSIYASESRQLQDFKALGVLETLALDDLSPAKVRMIVYHSCWHHFLDCLVLCNFVPFNYRQVEELVRGVTGWNSTVWELMKVGERCLAMTRAFNIREGLGKKDDLLPERFFTPLPSGPLQGVSIGKDRFEQAKETFYSMMGWNKMSGVPSLWKLQELGIEWVSDYLGGEVGD
ncbi:MAG TPA: aldehyde ferredoxin oxidoreductase family protein [Dehalococcoidia bacterium]|nr:aldehyde ferredoxin oxidoreductase family protein [Dehalococcoidia bacterium]